MRMAQVEEVRVRVLHLLRDPCAVLTWTRSGTSLHHLPEATVEGDLQSASANRLAQRARHVHIRREEHHARVGAPPQQRIVLTEPGEDAMGIGIEQTFRRKIATGSEQTVGIGQRTLDRWKRIVRAQERNHVFLILH